GDGGVQPRARARAGVGHVLPRGGVHQPLPGPPGLPPPPGRLLRRQGQPVHSRLHAGRRGEHRRPACPVPRDGRPDHVRAPPRRLERIEAGQAFALLVDYSHKPGAVEAMLAALRPVTGGRLAIVLGCGGDRDRAKRPLMGAAAARLADVAILTSDNPRTEDPLAILGQMLEGVLTVPEPERARLIIEPDRAPAIGL